MMPMALTGTNAVSDAPTNAPRVSFEPVESGPSFELTKTLKLSANLGRRTREKNLDYTAMNVGATKNLARGFAIDLRYYRTNRSNLDDIYRSRAVVSGRWTF